MAALGRKADGHPPSMPAAVGRHMSQLQQGVHHLQSQQQQQQQKQRQHMFVGCLASIKGHIVAGALHAALAHLDTGVCAHAHAPFTSECSSEQYM
jgi:hypothetical protein